MTHTSFPTLDQTGVAPLEARRGESGLTFLKRLISGEHPPPPITAVLKFKLAEAESGWATFIGLPGFDFYNPIGSVHGGWASTLLDSCMSCAILTLLPAGQGFTTLELKVNLLRPISDQTGLLRAEGRAIHVGRTVATADGRLVDAAGKLYAHGTTTCAVLSL